MSLLNIDCYCAWSLHTCWMEGYPSENNCPTIDEVLKECNVRRFTARSVEPGFNLEESIRYNRDTDDKARYESRGLYPDPANEYLHDEEDDSYLKDDKGKEAREVAQLD